MNRLVSKVTLIPIGVITLLAGCSQAEMKADDPSMDGTQMADMAMPDMDMSAMDMSGMNTGNIADPNAPMDHSHIPIEVPEAVPVPRLSLEVSRDWMTGLNLQLRTENYRFTAPPNGLSMGELMSPSLDHDAGVLEGHAHLYINGEKIQRIYGPDIHLPETLFVEGINQITVSINNHGHMYWTQGTRQILASVFLDLSKDDLIIHTFESFPIHDDEAG